MKRVLITVFLLSLFSLAIPKRVLAVTVTVSNIPTSISSDSFSMDVSVLGAQPGTNYLRTDFYKEGTDNYFGDTYANNNWQTPTADGTSYFSIEITSPDVAATATIQARVGNPSPSYYLGPGNYKLKIRRYTSQSNYSFSDPYDVNITIAASPSPSPSASPSPSPSPSLSPSPSPSPLSSPSPKPSLKPSPSPSRPPAVLAVASEEPIKGQFLGLGTHPTASPLVASQEVSGKRLPMSAVVFIAGGLSLVGLALYMFFKSYQNQYNEDKDKKSL